MFLSAVCVGIGIVDTLVLSDGESSVGFTDLDFCQYIGLQPVGDWVGVIQTLYYKTKATCFLSLHQELGLSGRNPRVRDSPNFTHV